MAKRPRFPPEATTQPEHARIPGARTSGPAPKSRRSRADAPTQPPPKSKPKPTAPPRSSGIESRKRPKADKPHATVDEVTADLSRDPRREKE